MPVRDFLLNSDGSRVVVNGDFVRAGATDDGAAGSDALNQAAVAQGARVRVQLFEGEYWLDESKGVPYFRDILIKNPNPLVVREAIRSAIASTPDVVQVTGAALQGPSSDRKASILYQAVSKYSATPIAGQAVVG